jgi:putative oxidoreductase
MKAVLDLMGRIFLSVTFIFEAYDSIAFARDTKAKMIAYGITWQTDFLFLVGVVILTLGGILVLIGYRASFGAILLLLYYLPTTFIVHSFWNDPAIIERDQSILFMKNISICGGLLMVLVNGSGPISVKRLFATFKVPGT